MNLNKRILALGLALCLCLGLLPMGALAAQAAVMPDARYVVVHRGDEASLLDLTAEPDYEIMDGAALRAALAAGSVAWYEEDPEAVLLGDMYKWDHTMIGFEKAETANILGQGITVAFIDSGASPHDDYDANLLPGLNVLDNSDETGDTLNHGSAVAGILAAAINGDGINGTAPKAKLLPIKAFDAGVTSYGSDLAKGIRAAVDTYGVKLINMSCGLSQGSTLLKNAVEYAAQKGVIIVAAAGNYGSAAPFYPAAYSGVIGVASVNRNGTVSSFSERTGVWVAAPGESIYTTNNTGGHTGRSGTSFASPAVSGIVADMLTVNGSLTPENVRSILRDTAVDAGDPGYDNEYGYGIVSLSAALDYLLTGTDYYLSAPELTDTGTVCSVYNNTSSYAAGTLVQACWNSALQEELLSADAENVILAPGQSAVLATGATRGYVRDAFLAQDGTVLAGVKSAMLAGVAPAADLISFALPAAPAAGEGVLLTNAAGEPVFGEIALRGGTYAIPMRASLYDAWRAANACTFTAVTGGETEPMVLHENNAVPLPDEGVIRSTCTVCGTVSDEPQVPANVTDVTAAPVEGGIALTWSPADYATSYRVYRREPGGSWKAIANLARGEGCACTDSGGIPCTAYEYTVRGVNGSLLSPKYHITDEVVMPYFPAVITAQPEDITAAAGENALITVGASGSDLVYRWQYKSPAGTGWAYSSLDGNRTDTLTVPATFGRDGYSYRCKVTGSAGKVVYSEPATLTVVHPITITAQPEDIAAAVNSTAVFTAAAEGKGLTYQWQYRSPAGTKWASTTLTGNKTDTLTVNVIEGRNGYSYRCKLTDAAGYCAYTEPAVLTVTHPIVITAQPESVTAAVNGNAVFTAAAEGEGLSYQWQYKSPAGTKWAASTLTGNKTDTLTVKAIAGRDGYSYRCMLTDAAGNVQYSEPAVLTVS